jgi:arylsulfatase A-like enzyme
MLKGYFAAVTAMDQNIGRIIRKVAELGLTGRTLLIFSSDNGFSCGHHGFWGKGNGTFPLNMYEHSVRVPMILSHPGRLSQGRVCDAMASQYDLFPTILDYVGLDAPKERDLPGVTLLPVLEGDRAAAREDLVVFDEYGPVRMIRTEEWKYVHRYPYGYHELYDVRRDPEERNNLAKEPGRAGVVSELRRRLFRWFDRYVDPEMDGSRLPVNGSGQRTRVEDGPAGVGCFYDDRLVTGADGVPRMDHQTGDDRLNELIQDR